MYCTAVVTHIKYEILIHAKVYNRVYGSLPLSANLRSIVVKENSADHQSVKCEAIHAEIEVDSVRRAKLCVE